MGIRVGTSGWSYNHWNVRFYPAHLPSTGRLVFYAKEFDTVELNSSFYHLPREKTFLNWRERTPTDFVFAVKGSRWVTHVKKLSGVGDEVNTFCKRAVNLGEKLGPILWQLPPQLKRNEERLEGFLECLPEDLTHVVEFRRKDWFDDGIYALLRSYDVSFCSVSSPSFVTDLVVTGEVGYLRMHGEGGGWYATSYGEDQLSSWAKRISQSFSSCRASYVYFNNDASAYAIQNARDLRNLLH